MLDGATVTDVARRNKVSRQTVHEWLRRYAAHGLAGLIDTSSKPDHSPQQMAPAIEGQVVEMRRNHPGWGPRTIGYQLAVAGLDPVLVAPRSIAASSVTTSSSPPRGADDARTTSVRSGPVPWSSGRWTSSGASSSPTAPSSRR